MFVSGFLSCFGMPTVGDWAILAIYSWPAWRFWSSIRLLAIRVNPCTIINGGAMDGRRPSRVPTATVLLPIQYYLDIAQGYPQMASSQQSRSHDASYVGSGALAKPVDSWNVDMDMLDTGHWTAEDWEAARILAEQLRLRNAAKAKRAAEGGNDQGCGCVNDGMWEGLPWEVDNSQLGFFSRSSLGYQRDWAVCRRCCTCT